MTRFVSVCVAIAGTLATVALVAPNQAHADFGMLPGGAQITFNRLFITEGGQTVEPSTPDAVRRYLNLAHCVCSQAGAGEETRITYEVGLTFDTNTSRPGEIWVGNTCEDDLLRGTMCRSVGTIPDIDLLATRPDNIDVSLYDVINGVDNMAACQERESDAFLWILVDSNADNVFDYFANQSVGKGTDVAGIDTQPPPLPTDFSADSAERAVRLSWTPPESRSTDVFYYQALCADQDGNPALANPPAPRYQTVRSLCNLEQDIELTASEIDGDDDAMAVVPDALRRLDPAFVCADSVDPTARGLLIEGLENDVPYTVALVAIDRAGNATGTYFTSTITPRPATDFWEDLHDRGSNVEGGFCLLAETYGDNTPLTQTLRAFRDGTLAQTLFGRALIAAYYATTGGLGEAVHGSLALRVLAAILLAPLVVIALLWHALTLPGLLGLLALAWIYLYRRRWLTARFARLAAPAAFALAVLAPVAAHAQGPTPYWEEEARAAELADEEETVSWHAGIRLGPYTPEIDKQFGMEPGPYADMFGGYQVLPMVDIDWIFWRGFGQLGVGGTIGYMQKSAKAWVDGSIPGDPMRPRSQGDTNTFRLVPLALTAVYRFTWLDDRFGVPIVPYVRGGLSYYLWWVRSNSDTASACWDGSRDPDCDADKAIGGTAGLQGSIGVAIRAERVDADAAASMRAGGIMHAGFYAELSLAKVDGFGSDEKLSVGDTTWFAGVNFEF